MTEASRVQNMLNEQNEWIDRLKSEVMRLKLDIVGYRVRNTQLEAALSLAENWMSNRAVHFGELCTSKQCVCGKALVLFNVLQALEGKDG